MTDNWEIYSRLAMETETLRGLLDMCDPRIGEILRKRICLKITDTEIAALMRLRPGHVPAEVGTRSRTRNIETFSGFPLSIVERL